MEIEIVRVGPDGEDLLGLKSPPKKAKLSPTSASDPSPSKPKGPAPKPYLEKSLSSRKRDAAKIRKGADENAIYHAAFSKVKKNNKDMAYMMTKMKEEEGLASKIRKWYHLYKQKKGTVI